jgi:hypothetical protein
MISAVLARSVNVNDLESALTLLNSPLATLNSMPLLASALPASSASSVADTIVAKGSWTSLFMSTPSPRAQQESRGVWTR